jgi:glycosyltransferase involved in cell wall biosynthesis
MKIAHVVDSMEVGGAETVVSQMCRLQREQGHSPYVLAIAALGPLVRSGIGKHLTDSSRSLYRIFKGSHPDVVHMHNPTPTIYAAVAARLAAVPSIVSTRHSLVARPRRLSVEIKYGLAATCCDWVAGICNATVTNVKEIHSMPSRKVVCVYNGATPLRRVAVEELPEKDGFTLVFVGRVEPVKNHSLLFSAFQIALATEPGLRLWMVGDGSERRRLEALAAELGISDRVTFWGRQLDVAPFLAAADVFIMSSVSEGLPISLLQAFSAGIPAIVTDVGGMAEVVRLAQGGIVVPLHDPSAMADAIMKLARNEAERRHLSVNAEEAFRARFSLQTMVEGYEALYRNTSRARRAAPA